MALSLDDFQSTTRKGPRCSVGLLLDGLPESDRAVLQAAFDNPAIGQKDIARTVADKLNVEIQHGTFGRHIRGECRC